MNRSYIFVPLAIILLLSISFRQVAQATYEKDLAACTAKLDGIKARAAKLQPVELYSFERSYQHLGYRDKQGKIVIPPKFREARHFFQGRAVVADQNWHRGVIDSKGSFVVPYKFVWISDFMNGVAIFSGTKENRDQKGVIDLDGNIIFEFQGVTPWEEFSGFKNGRAKVYRHQKFSILGNPVAKDTGYVDCTGRVVMEDW